MREQFEEQLVPLFEFLGIPLIILGPLISILYILFKFIIPKMLSRNTNVTGMLVANIVAQLFGEGDNVVKGVTELELVKLIKSLPEDVRKLFRKTDEIVQDVFKQTNKKLNDVTELIAMLSQAMMAERLVKPQSSRILHEIKLKADLMLAEANDVVDVVEEDEEDTNEETKEDIEEVEV